MAHGHLHITCCAVVRVDVVLSFCFIRGFMFGFWPALTPARRAFTGTVISRMAVLSKLSRIELTKKELANLSRAPGTLFIPGAVGLTVHVHLVA
jgi:hypothetical protein